MDLLSLLALYVLLGAGVRYFSDDALNITQILLFSKQQAFM